MSKFQINLEGVGSVPVLKGTTRKLSFAWLRPWKNPHYEKNAGYIVMMPQNQIYLLKRNEEGSWSAATEAVMQKTNEPGKKWVSVQPDQKVQEMRRAIDVYEKMNANESE